MEFIPAAEGDVAGAERRAARIAGLEGVGKEEDAGFLALLQRKAEDAGAGNDRQRDLRQQVLLVGNLLVRQEDPGGVQRGDHRRPGDRAPPHESGSGRGARGSRRWAPATCR